MDRTVVKLYHIDRMYDLKQAKILAARRSYFLVGKDGKILWKSAEGKLLPDAQVIEAVKHAVQPAQ